MISIHEQEILEKLLELGPDPLTTFTLDELLGYLFGLAITPEPIPGEEWMPVIFDGQSPEFESMAQAEEMTSTLVGILTRMQEEFAENRLHFPFDYDELEPTLVETLFDWSSGFEEALALREELWDPEEFPTMAEFKKLELFEAMTSIGALVDPEEFGDLLERMPDEMFDEVFAGIDTGDRNREEMLMGLLLSNLPQTVAIFQDHSRKLSGKIRSRAGSQQEGNGSKDKIIRVDFKNKKRLQNKTDLGSPSPQYVFNVELAEVEPPIWRRIQVPGNASLADFHQILQISMGWYNSHLHQFMIDRTCYCPPDDDDFMRTSRPLDESLYTLHQLADKLASPFLYIYDFGDDWLHRITLEETVESEAPNPKLLAGERACPPEDCGGIPGYLEIVNILSDPKHPNYLETLKWLGRDYDPENFGAPEIVRINEQLTRFIY